MNNNLKKLSILNYQEAYDKGENIVGGKAFSIAKLYVNGVKVPNGIIFPYQNWELLRENKTEYMNSYIIKNITDTIKCDKYAVRSSAVGEDSKQCSWAGCFETVLNIKEDELKNAIWVCGNSLYSKRVEAYSKLHKDIPKIRYMGILIQEYISADWSGVCFSANPITKNKDELIIECQIGKSGSVVGGYGEPITVILNKYENIQEKKYEIPIEIIKLVKENVEKISSIWNCEVDVEWVIKDNKIIITQTRPITTI